MGPALSRGLHLQNTPPACQDPSAGTMCFFRQPRQCRPHRLANPLLHRGAWAVVRIAEAGVSAPESGKLGRSWGTSAVWARGSASGPSGRWPGAPPVESCVSEGRAADGLNPSRPLRRTPCLGGLAPCAPPSRPSVCSATLPALMPRLGSFHSSSGHGMSRNPSPPRRPSRRSCCPGQAAHGHPFPSLADGGGSGPAARASTAGANAHS
jgi:hypothetical protein